MKKYDVTALGEILIDFTYHSNSENGMALFEQNPGGAPANLLTAVQRLGGKTAFIGKVGNDVHGIFLKNVIESIGISTEGMLVDDHFFTTLAFVNLSPTGERSFSFARKPGADTQISKNEINCELIKNSKVFHIGSLSLTDEPSCTATFKALKYARKNDITISYDPNYRKMLWKDQKTAIKAMGSILKYVDIIKFSEEEIKLLTDADNPRDASKELMGKGIDCVIITLGSKGAYIATRNNEATVPSEKVQVTDTTGAGDSFMGAFLYKMTSDNKKPNELTKEDITRYAIFANKVAGIVVGKRGAINAMPTMAEIL